MGLETVTYPTFVGGVSQQDDTVRSQSQVTAGHNSWPHAAMGMGKRPGAAYVGTLRFDLDPASHFHSIVRDQREKYVVAISHGKIAVFDHETGEEYQVYMADPAEATAYLNAFGAEPWTIFKTATMADTTFVVNTGIAVRVDESSQSPGSVVGSVQTIADLPKGTAGAAVPTGSVYKVSGTDTTPFDDFYVQKQGDNVWLETGKPGIPWKFDDKTMPHVLKRIPDANHQDGFYFAFGTSAWDGRLAGDDSTNPGPSFVGETIKEVFVHRNRLGFLATENVVLSETDSYFNFWRTTVTQFLDSDPIDVTVSTNGVATLYHAIPFQSSVYLAAANGQYLLTAEPFLSPKNVKVDPANNYSSSPYVRPTLLADSLYIADDDGAFAAMREYFMDDLSITGDAADVTAHVPRYIPGRVRAMATNTVGDCVLAAVHDPKGNSQLYVYNVRWSGDEKTQSAWVDWKLTGLGRVCHLHSIGDFTYAVVSAPNGGCDLFRFDLALNADDADASRDYQFLLDQLVLTAPLAVEFGNYTDITVPYAITDLSKVSVLKTDDWGVDAGSFLDMTGATVVANQTIRLPGVKLPAKRVAVGYDFDSYVTLTKPMFRDRQGTAITVGRTQVRDITVAYKDAAYLECRVKNKGKVHVTEHVSSSGSRVLSATEFTLSAPSFRSGKARFPVQTNADHVEITLANPLPFQAWLQSAQARVLYTSKSRV